MKTPSRCTTILTCLAISRKELAKPPTDDSRFICRRKKRQDNLERWHLRIQRHKIISILKQCCGNHLSGMDQCRLSNSASIWSLISEHQLVVFYKKDVASRFMTMVTWWLPMLENHKNNVTKKMRLPYISAFFKSTGLFWVILPLWTCVLLFYRCLDQLICSWLWYFNISVHQASSL